MLMGAGRCEHAAQCFEMASKHVRAGTAALQLSNSSTLPTESPESVSLSKGPEDGAVGGGGTDAAAFEAKEYAARAQLLLQRGELCANVFSSVAFWWCPAVSMCQCFDDLILFIVAFFKYYFCCPLLWSDVPLAKCLASKLL
jgi:hypothetical protein